MARILTLCLFVAGCTGVGSDRRDEGADHDTGSDTDTGTAEPDPLCEPDEIWCDQGWVSECDGDGMGWSGLEDCAALGLVCAAGECTDTTLACAEAINERSYIGCEYWAVTLANGVDDSFSFAVAVANDSAQVANLEITNGSTSDNSYAVPPHDMIVIDTLEWNAFLKEPFSSVQAGQDGWYTRHVANGAYRISSDRPITAYQFNPLSYENASGFSYTNDASLLLPTHVYREEYIAITRQPMHMTDCEDTPYVSNPGLFAIVGVGDEPTNLRITLSAHTIPSDSYAPVPIPGFAPGDTFETSIREFEVLQLLGGIEDGCTAQTGSSGYCYCNPPEEYDLTGSHIEVLSGPSPAVFGGHACAFIPYNKPACDHLEQQLFPLDTWGRHYLCAHPITQAPTHPTVWRIVSGADDNEITFTPSEVHAPITLDKGEHTELESLASFELQGEKQFIVAQFMVGQLYDVNWDPGVGDPAMSLVVPVEQYRIEYTFLSPDTYLYNYLTVIHRSGHLPELDGEPVSGHTEQISGDWSRTNLEIEPGWHRIDDAEPFMISVYGVGAYTSYLYPGGLFLKPVTEPVQ